MGRRLYTWKGKYPDTKVFHWYNANPKGKIVGDCSYRAMSTGLDQDYNQTVMEFAEMTCKTGYPADKHGIDYYLKSKGWVKHKQPRKSDNTKYTGKDFCKLLQKNLVDGTHKELNNGIVISDRIICNIGGHHIVAVVDGKVWDIWDSTDGCIGNYWTKG